MKPYPSICRLVPAIALAVVVSFLLGACASKAKLIQTGAAQFESESLAAIQKMDDLRQREIASPPMSSQKASEFFVKAVKNSTAPISDATLNILMEPTKINAGKSDAQWQSFLQKLRMQHSAFTDTFRSLDRGSMLGASRVGETVPVLDKLIGQMAAMASSIRKNPAAFIGERAAIAAELERVRGSRPYNDITDMKLLDIERRLRDVVAAENRASTETMGQTLKAVKIGTELRKLLVAYDNVTLDDIAEGLSEAFRLAGSIQGVDLSRLKAESDGIIMQINENSELKGFLAASLEEINAARASTGK